MPSENQQVLRLRQTYLMRRFLLLALGMGFLLPTAVNAERHWLILGYGEFNNGSMNGVTNGAAALEKIEMVSAAACKKEGKRWENSDTHKDFLYGNYRRFHCVVGK